MELFMQESSGSLGALQFEARNTESVASAAHSLNFQLNFTTVPLIFANIGTFHGGESAMVRTDSRSTSQVTVEIQEDNCVSHNTAHTTENLAMVVIQNDAGGGVLRAEKVLEPTTFCAATNTHFTFVDTGQFISWSLAKHAASHHVVSTSTRAGMKSHLATINSKAEQDCVRTVSQISRDELNEVAVGWIGATDAEWMTHWYDIMSVHHADPLAAAESDGVPWTRFARDGAQLDANEQLGVPSTNVPGYHELSMIESEQGDCGGLGTIVGGYGRLGHDHYIQKTYGVDATGNAQKPLPLHAALQIKVDFIKVDSWDGETAYMWVEGAAENPVWQHRFRHNTGRNYCGSSNNGWREQVYHISQMVERPECEVTAGRPDWCSTLTMKFNSTLNQHTNDESFGIQNVIVSYRAGVPVWRWGVDDGTPLTGYADPTNAPAYGAAVSANSPWHPGNPKGGDAHYVAVDWPNWEAGAWHDCESDNHAEAPVWPRCFYGLHSLPRVHTGPSACDQCTVIPYTTAQWPGDVEWGMTMVLDVVSDNALALVPAGNDDPNNYLSIMAVTGQWGERSPAVWIKPHATERRLHIRTSTRDNSDFGCDTEDLNGLAGVTDPAWVKPTLGRMSADPKQYIHLAITVSYEAEVSRLYVYINGHIASADCDGKEATAPIQDYDAPMFIGGDLIYSGFSGEVESICLHPNYLNAGEVGTLFTNDVKAARGGVHVEAAHSLSDQIEQLTNGRVLTNLAIPFRWDNMDAQFGHATDSFHVPGDALKYPGLEAHSDVGTFEFGMELTAKVLQAPNGQHRNVFHLGNDAEGFAHVCILEKRSMKLIVGVAEVGETEPTSLRASCESAIDIFLDEDVVLVYSFSGSATTMTGKLYVNGGLTHGCQFTAAGVDTAALRTKMVALDPVTSRANCEHLHLLLGDAMEARHGLSIAMPGFYGDISRIVLHEAGLTAAHVADLYEPNCGKHLHGYYVESTLPPQHIVVGGAGLLYDPELCEGECFMAKALTIIMLGGACVCCGVFAFIFYEKPPAMIDISPEMMPTMDGGSGGGMQMDDLDYNARNSTRGVSPARQAPPVLSELRDLDREDPSPARRAAPSLDSAGARSNTPERAPARVAPPRGAASPARRAAPSLETIATAQGLSPARRRPTGLPDLEETEVNHRASVKSFGAAFEQGHAPGGSLEELKANGFTVRTRSKSPARRSTAA